MKRALILLFMTSLFTVIYGQEGNVSPNKYTPAGSYLKSSRNVTMTINAYIKNKAGEEVFSTVTYKISDTKYITDIVNNDGKLEVVYSKTVQDQSESQSISPWGSYGYSMNYDKTNYVLKAECKDIHGKWLTSSFSFTYAETDASMPVSGFITNISNDNGKLVAVRVE